MFKAGHRRRIDLQVNLSAGHQTEHHTIGEETGPAEHAAHTDSAKRLEQIVDKFGIHNFCVSNSSVCHSATLQGIVGLYGSTLELLNANRLLGTGISSCWRTDDRIHDLDCSRT